MDGGAAIGVAGLVTALLSAAAAAWVLVSNARHANRIAAGKAEADDRERIIDRLNAQIDRLERQLGEHQRAVDWLQARESECEVLLERVHGALDRHQDALARAFACIRRSGQDPGEMPAPLPRQPREEVAAAAEFLRRQSAQSAGLARAVGEGIRAQGEKKP